MADIDALKKAWDEAVEEAKRLQGEYTDLNERYEASDPSVTWLDVQAARTSERAAREARDAAKAAYDEAMGSQDS